jgi:hypothetical protein
VKQLGAFLWDFVVGDDWVGAAGIAALLAATWAVAHLARVPAWWLLPPGVAAVLGTTLRRAVRAATASATSQGAPTPPPG